MAGNLKNIVTAHERSEKTIEKYLREKTRTLGGLCLKFSSMTETGYPDRIVIFPGGITAFFELKSKGEKPTKLQSLRHDTLREMGFPVYVPDSREQVDESLDELRRLYEI